MAQGSRREGLADRVFSTRPRLLLAAAGPGWGKTYLARELCARASSSAMIEFSSGIAYEEALQRVTAVLGDPIGRLAHDLIVLDDADVLVALGGASTVEAIMRAVPPSAMLVLTSALPIDQINPSRYFAPHEILTLRRDTFEFTQDEAREIIGASYLPTTVLESAVRLSQGWPILIFLFARLAREGKLEEALADRSSWLLDPYHQYVKQRVLSRLLPEEVEAFAAIAALHGGDADEISAALGWDATPTLVRFEKYRYYAVVFEGNRYHLTTMPESALLALFPQEIKQMRIRAARAFHNNGKHVRAARLALEAADFGLAGVCLDATGRRKVGEVQSREYYEVAKGLPLETVFRSHHVFLELFVNRRVRARPFPMYERVRDFCETMTPDSEPLVRFSARVAYATMLRQTLHVHEAEAQIDECLKMVGLFPNAHDRRALLRAERAMIAAFRGRLDDGEAIWNEPDPHADPPMAWFPYRRWLMDLMRALCEGDAAVVRSLTDQNIEAARLWDDSESLAHAIDVSVICRSTVDPAEEIGPIEERLRRVVAHYEDERPSGKWAGHFDALFGIFAAFGQTDVDLAKRLIDESIAICDRIGYPYWQIAARLAASLIPDADRAGRVLAQCASLASQMQAAKIQGQIEGLVRGSAVRGPYSSYIHALTTAPLLQRQSVLRVRMLDRKVTRDGKDLKVRQREFELLAHLALAGGPVSVDSLCEAMWPDSDEQAAVASLRMSVSRLRKQLDDPDAITSVSAGYQLASSISVDILEAESAFVALRRLPQLSDDDRSALHALFQYVCSVGSDVGLGQSWFERIERRIEDLRHGSGVLLAKEYLRIGEALAAQEVAEMLLRFDPLDEEAVSLCVKALTAANDKTAATRLWQQYVKRLSADYGAKPGVTIAELVEF